MEKIVKPTLDWKRSSSAPDKIVWPVVSFRISWSLNIQVEMFVGGRYQ
jgi:hypothetical protein